VPASLFDDGNGYRIMIASLGVKQTLNNTDALLTPARTFERLQNDLVGGVYFSFSKYSLQVTQQPQYTRGVDPSTNAPPQPFNRLVGYSVADYNVENLYDFRDDPFDGCDFTGNTGCPGVSPPFDYVPASNAVYQARLGEIAAQIVTDLHSPDILLAQEAEDQDICTVTAAALVCGTTDNRDGKPDTLQELALRIKANHGVSYDAAYDRDGSDDRGIVSGFLYRTDRVELLPATAAHPVLGSSPTVQYNAAGLPYNTDVQNPKALNADLPAGTPGPTDGSDVYTRDPQVGYFRVWRVGIGQGGWTDLYAISEHFSSTPDSRVAQRREQARYTGRIVTALAGAPDGARVVVGGDFNVYPRPDDPFAPPNTSDQLGPLYDEAGMNNLYDVLVAQERSAAYSYVFQGQTQTLDGQFTTDLLLDELQQARVAHVNADFPADTPGDGARGLSDHDPLVAQFRLTASSSG
jgi:predicted extracellular nuclease